MAGLQSRLIALARSEVLKSQRQKLSNRRLQVDNEHGQEGES